jgi:hypothetical protein
MIPSAIYLYWKVLAADLHCILWWHVFSNGDYLPLMQPVDDETWELMVQ